MRNRLLTIGRAEKISFLDCGIDNLPAKIDTGAYRSSVWATGIHEADGRLSFRLLGPDSIYYTGIDHTTEEYRIVEVENSFGHKQKRYSIFLRVRMSGKTIRSNFTLADRAEKTYPVLIGRKMLRNRFVVDVSEGVPIDNEAYGDDSLE